MKKWPLLLVLQLLLIDPQISVGAELEDTIEDEIAADGNREPEIENEIAADEDREPEIEDGEQEVGDGEQEVEDVADTDAESEAEGSSEAEEEEFDEFAEDDSSEGSGDDTADENQTADVSEKQGTELESDDVPQVASDEGIYAETLSGFDDRTNPEFESRLHQIFSQPRAIASSYDALAVPHSAELYKIQNGDTLWEISEMFFGSGAVWPRLWSENSRLTNPHEIQVGKAVAFVAGTEESAPYINIADLSKTGARASVTRRLARLGGLADGSEFEPPVYPDDPEALEGSPEGEVAAGTVLEEQAIVGGRPDIPPPSAPSKSMLKDLPPSFLMPVAPSVARLFDGTGLDVGRRSAVDQAAVVWINSYLGDGKPGISATVEEIDDQERTAGLFNKIIIRGRRELSVGERFTAVMPRGNVTQEKSGTFGPVLEVGGLVEVTDVIDSRKKIFRGTVVRSLNAIDSSALLIEEPMPRGDFTIQGPRSDIQARIVGGDFGTGARVLGSGTTVYLDEGSKAGLAEGQLLAVRGVRGGRRPDTRFPSLGDPIAVLKIVRVYPKVSTALIVSAVREVQAGDLTGGPFPKSEDLFRKGASSSMAREGGLVAQDEPDDGFGDADLEEGNGANGSDADAAKTSAEKMSRDETGDEETDGEETDGGEMSDEEDLESELESELD